MLKKAKKKGKVVDRETEEIKRKWKRLNEIKEIKEI